MLKMNLKFHNTVFVGLIKPQQVVWTGLIESLLIGRCKILPKVKQKQKHFNVLQ